MRREEITVSRLVEQRKHTEAERKLCYPILCGHSFSSSAFFQSIISLMRFLFHRLWPFILHDAPIMNHVYSSAFVSSTPFLCIKSNSVLQHEGNQSFQQCLCSVVKTHLPRGKYTNVSAPGALFRFSLFFCLDVSSLPSCSLELQIFIEKQPLFCLFSSM